MSKPKAIPKPLEVCVRGERIVIVCSLCGGGFDCSQEHRCHAKRSELPQERRATTGMGHALPRETFRSEAEFGSVALKEVQRLPGIMAWRVNSGRRGGVRFGGIVGAPDIHGIVGKHGQFFAVELKTPLGKTTPEQDAWHARAIERGALVWVARSLDEVIRPLVEALR